MKIKTAILTASIAFGASFSSAGEPVVDSSKAMTLQPPPVASPFERALRPVTSPTLFDLPLPRTQANLVFIHQNHPDRLRTIIGDVPVGGDFQVYALQLELALSERFSLVAAKAVLYFVLPRVVLAVALLNGAIALYLEIER